MRENRNDIATSTATGFPIVSNERIKEIQIKINDVLTKKYQINYTTGDNGIRSVLDTITEIGYDQSLISTTLPPTSFKYQAQNSMSSSTWTIDTNYSSPPVFIANEQSKGTRIADVNGDGMLDMIQAHDPQCCSSPVIKDVHINNGDGTGWTLDTNYSIPIIFTTGFTATDKGVRIVDIDGDGFADMLRSWEDGIGNKEKHVYINNGNGTGWTEDLNYSTSSLPIFVKNENDMGVRIADVNGDSLPDLLRSWVDGASNETKNVYINNGNGTGWAEDLNYSTSSMPIFSENGTDNGVRMSDVNGYNLIDFIQAWKKTSSNTIKNVYINNGDYSGWTIDNNYSIPFIFVDEEGRDASTRISDVNGDGLVDILMAHNPLCCGGSVQATYINNGNGTGWTLDTNYSIPSVFTSGTVRADKGVRVIDINGDGLPDFLRSWTGSSPAEQDVLISDNKKADLLSKITRHTGSIISVDYITTALTTKIGTTAQANPKLPFSFDVVKSVTRNEGFGLIATTTYAYRGGEYIYNNEFDRKFAGFATTTATDALGNITKTYFHTGNTTQSDLGEYNDNISKIGKQYREEIYDDSENLYKTSITRWDNISLSNGRDFVKATTTLQLQYDGDADHRDIATVFEYDNTNGNITTKIEYGEVSGNSNGSFTDSGSDKRTTVYTYAASTTLHILGLPSKETIKNNVGAIIAESKYYYDGLSLGSVSKGNLTKKEDLISGSNYINIERIYDGIYGLVTQEKDPRVKAINFVYDIYNLYVATSTNAKNQSTVFEYDYSSGKVATTTDANGYKFVTVFDGLDRPIAEKVPNLDSPSLLVTKKSISYIDTIGSRRILETNHLNNATSSTAYRYFDGMDRIIQSRTEMEDSNTYAIKDIVYDERGNISKETLPYIGVGILKTNIITDSDLFTIYTYDALNRLKTSVNAMGTESYSYDQWWATTTDRNTNKKASMSDAHGNLVQVNEDNLGTIYSTSYEYDTLNNLTKITDALGNIRNFTYDGLSRVTRSEDLHNSVDITFASTTYAYDATGNITTTLDQKNQTTNFTYDDINRVLTEDYTGGAGTEISYGYDWCSNGIGRFCSSTTTDIVTKNEYNPLGLISKEIQEIVSKVYNTIFNYDRQGNQTKVIYPDTSEVSYIYNGAGLLNKVLYKEVGTTTPTTIIQNYDYHTSGQILRTQFGNNIQADFLYSTTTEYRIKSINTSTTTAMIYGKASSVNVFNRVVMFILNSIIGTPELVYAQENVFATTTISKKILSNTDVLPVSQIRNLLIRKSSSEKANIKGLEIAKLNFKGKSTSKEYGVKIEIIKIEKIEGGVQVFARAWKNGKQLGFGKDGSVDIERFRIFNPPILVDDLGGDIIREWEEKDLETGLKRTRQRKLREDPNEAIRQVVSHNVTLVGKENTNIISGKVGNTTSTFYPDSDTESTSVDGDTRGSYRGCWGWASEHADTNSTQVGDAGDSGVQGRTGPTNLNNANCVAIYRSIYLFDTSVLTSGDIINSANFSVYSNIINNQDNDGDDWLVVTKSTPTSNTSIANNDYDNVGAITNPTEGSSRVDLTSMTASAYTSYTLNSTGLGWIDKDGVTKLGLREGHDVLNRQYVGGSGWTGNQIFPLFADKDGTANDPKLVVVHTNPNQSPYAPTSLEAEGVQNPLILEDNIPEFSAIYNDFNNGDIAGDYQIQVSTSTDFSTIYWDSTKTALVSTTTEGSRSENISYTGNNLASSTTYYWRVKFWDDEPSEGVYSTSTAFFSLNSASSPPINLQTEGQTNPTNITDPTPEFSAIYTDPDATDIATYYQIQVATSSAYWVAPHWNSTKTLLASSTPENTRIADISYAGNTLASSTHYYWRIKFWDNSNTEGTWSTTTASFALETPPDGFGLQNITYVHDSLGNITQITDNSATHARNTTTYTYDSLNRLTLASTTVSQTNPYSRTYTYSPIGNILTKSDQGTYTYAQTNYTNPNAVTSINGTTHTYDKVGNTTAIGSNTYTWDYRNRLTTSVASGTTNNYLYNHNNIRIQKGNTTATTTYPNKYYNTKGATTTKHIFTPNGTLLATIEGNGQSTTTNYIHTDHLGGTNVVTDENANLVSLSCFF